MNSQYGVQYEPNPQYSPIELLPSFRKIPPPEVLANQARQNWEEYALPAAQFLGGQIAEKAALLGLTGKSLSQWLTHGGNKMLNTPQALATIAAIQSTRAGEPIINGIRYFAASPAGQKTKNLTQQAIDWLF